jgi:hypothetical protein
MENKSISISDFIEKQIKSPISVQILPISLLKDAIVKLFVLKYKLTSVVTEELVNKYLGGFLSEFREDLHVTIESPYVDKIYRDTYYNYYSSKLNRYYKDCIRISFFLPGVDFDGIMLNNLEVEELRCQFNETYMGFLILRPTFPKIIGRNSISPKAKKEHNFVCCLAKINSSVFSIKQEILSFPHASQDTQTMTCAETTVWSLLEYFGNKYPEYKPVLLTHITRTMQRFSYKRLLPSDGLTAEQITYAIREFGFGAMIHSKAQREDSEFNINYIIRTYVESGIPVVGVLKNAVLGHAVNIIGRENEDPAITISIDPHITFRDTPVIDFNMVERKYVFIDDNHAPYQVTTLDSPCKSYYKDEKWHDCEITNIIVPLHSKVYLDAAKASKNFYNILGHEQFGIKGKEKRILKIFLASTRSYKQYISLNKELNPLVKHMISKLSMPKFIWIAEISKTDSYLQGKCDDLYILDATEPYSDSSIFSNMSLLAGFTTGTFFVQNFGNINGINTFANPFKAYTQNLS